MIIQLQIIIYVGKFYNFYNNGLTYTNGEL